MPSCDFRRPYSRVVRVAARKVAHVLCPSLPANYRLTPVLVSQHIVGDEVMNAECFKRFSGTLGGVPLLGLDLIRIARKTRQVDGV
jgi:hypothetical protein